MEVEKALERGDLKDISCIYKHQVFSGLSINIQNKFKEIVQEAIDTNIYVDGGESLKEVNEEYPSFNLRDSHLSRGPPSIRKFLETFRLFLSKLTNKTRILLSIIKKAVL